MESDLKQREAFYLLKKYSSYTWYAEIFSLWKNFCKNYERDFYRAPVIAPAGDYAGAGTPYTPTDWDELNLKMFWAYAGDMEEGLNLLLRGPKARAHQLLDSGTRFNEWLFSRRFEEMDLSVFGYRRTIGHGVAEGIFSDAQKAYMMTMATCIFRHTDELRHDYAKFPHKYKEAYEVPFSRTMRIPFGVPDRELEPVPQPSSDMPSIKTGDALPEPGIWAVETDKDHASHTYAMAYLLPWIPAPGGISEQEHELNTCWERTGDEMYRNYFDKIKRYPVRWRLLWRDTRYGDGRIPPEEAEYLIYREPAAEIKAPVERLRCEAGDPCPREGWWVSPASSGRQYFKQCETMPSGQAGWGKTIWQLDLDSQ